MTELKSFQRKHLKSLAHHLSPVVYVGKKGLTEELVVAVDEALDAHELIKIKFNERKDEKREIVAALLERTNSAQVGMIGNVATLFRQHADEEKRRVQLPSR
jgi:RNA-binding protein